MAGQRRGEPWVLQHSLAILVVGAVGAFGAFLATYRLIDGTDTDRFDAGVRAGLAAAGLAAGLLTWGRLELSRHEHQLGVDRDLTDRYGRAVEAIGSQDDFVRIGGIYALERFALDAAGIYRDRDGDWRMALDVLIALTREVSADLRSAAEKVGADASTPLPDQPTPRVVIASVEVLGRFGRRTGLRRAAATAHILDRVVARGALMMGATLHGARLHGADLRDTDFGGADLSDADLTDADLRGAHLVGANLVNTNLARADLRGADLCKADLQGASLRGTDLREATLFQADLRGAALDYANACHADLRFGEPATATPDDQVSMDRIRHDDLTRWPATFTPPVAPSDYPLPRQIQDGY